MCTVDCNTKNSSSVYWIYLLSMQSERRPSHLSEVSEDYDVLHRQTLPADQLRVSMTDQKIIICGTCVVSLKEDYIKDTQTRL